MKAEIRKRILKERDTLPLNEISAMSKVIGEKLFSLNSYKGAKAVMFYASFKSEVSTMDMILHALDDGKRVLVPVVNQGGIIAAEIRAVKELSRKNKFGILEPAEIRKVPREDIDIVVVPCAAFDRLHHRLGYGYRYYDNFLLGMRAKKIGLAFSLQEADGIPAQEWDVKLDAIVTEKGIF
ncbi:5-formyltetrahydrofolate cyclo-ligase [Candidatus Woesearchaeota archaeon]|nr:5-formyltetrahydrofolate cyclo-ligase [Candidatus Woesearchaeota archaeon]